MSSRAPVILSCLIAGLFAFRAAAQEAPAKTINWSRDSSVMVLVPSGEFVMGSEKLANEKPRRKVMLKDFYLDKFEVTNRQYYLFCKDTGRELPMHMPDGKIPAGRENHPVNNVSFADADAYCKWAGKRLPTEEEWEKGARGTDGRVYPWGSGWDQNLSNNRTRAGQDTLPVGSIPRGASPYGMMDMAGNVWEWTDSWYKSYPGAPVNFDDTGKNRVVRGGAYFYSIELLRASYRHPLPPDDVSEYGGMRCALDPDKIPPTNK
jgi:formylglycine-generating enzyme required for sulfatase activity